MAVGPCKFRINLDSKDACQCSVVNDALCWGHGLDFLCCETCAAFCPKEEDRPKGKMVTELIGAGASAYIAAGPKWVAEQLPTLTKDLDRVADLFFAFGELSTIFDILDKAVINGLAPEKAAELADRYDALQRV